MWCDRCRADAAAEVSAETGRAACATCGADLGSVRRPATDQARDLLKRWSAGIEPETAAEPLTSAASKPATTATADAERRVRLRRPSAPPRPAATPPQLRVDAPHPRPAAAPPSAAHAPRVDAPHAGGPAPPHFDVHTAIATKTEQGGAGAQIAGQVLAYSGVLALTLGTALVIWGSFAAPPAYAPTGWRIATGGQMLLFLGVVTLVAGGLEQTSRDVRVRVESLGERLIRIEHAATGHALKGPHIPATSFAGQQTGHTRHARERV
jgi:hypothetical protein